MYVCPDIWLMCVCVFVTKLFKISMCMYMWPVYVCTAYPDIYLLLYIHACVSKCVPNLNSCVHVCVPCIYTHTYPDIYLFLYIHACVYLF